MIIQIVPQQLQLAEKAPLDGRFKFQTKQEADLEAYEGAIFFIIDKQLWFRYKTKGGLLISIADDALNALEYAPILHLHSIEDIRLLSEALNDRYTKAEVKNMIAAVINNIEWKKSVNTFADLATTYPNPEDGWTVSVKDDDVTYRFTGSSWIPISSNVIPLATDLLDGKMSSADKRKLNSIAEGAGSYVHPDNKDIRHVTDLQMESWSNKLDPVPGKGLSSNDFEHKYKTKLDEMLYTLFNLSFSSTPAAASYEKGQQLSISLNFSADRALTSLTVKRGTSVLTSNIEATAISDSTPVTGNTVYTILADDGKGFPQSIQSKSLSFNFLSRRYWGVSAKTSLSNADVLALNSELSSSRLQNRTFDCTGGKYFYFAWPSTLGVPSFVIGGLANTDFTKETIQVTNGFGFVEAYDVYHINTLQNGSAIPVTVQ